MSGNPEKPSLPTELPKAKSKSGCESFWGNYGGLCMAISGGFIFSIAMMIIKVLQKDHGVKAFGAALMLNLGIFIPAVFFILLNEYAYGWKRRTRVLDGLKPFNCRTTCTLMIQGTLQGCAIAFRTFSLIYLSVGDMTVIVFASPVLTTVLAHFILGEECGPALILIAIYTLIGVGLITKPPILTGHKGFDSNTLVGSALACGALMCLSMKFVVTRKITHVHFLAMTCGLGIFGILISLPLFLALEDPATLIPNDTEGLLLRLGLLSSFFASAFINMSLKMENAGLVSLVRSCDVIFAFLLQFLFLGVVPDLLSGIGALIVWSGVLIAGIRKWRMQKNLKKQIDEKPTLQLGEIKVNV